MLKLRFEILIMKKKDNHVFEFKPLQFGLLQVGKRIETRVLQIDCETSAK
jgi:hypothetical protein